MDIWQNENGFSFVHLFASIAILFLMLPCVAGLINAVQYRSNYEMFSIQQFFQYLQTEMNEAVDFQVNDHILDIRLKNGDIASFEEYTNQIRRRVSGKGHEVYLRDIKHVTFKEMSYGVHTKIDTMDGKQYEKIIFFYE